MKITNLKQVTKYWMRLERALRVCDHEESNVIIHEMLNMETWMRDFKYYEPTEDVKNILTRYKI